jgi:hypothetical protein
MQFPGQARGYVDPLDTVGGRRPAPPITAHSAPGGGSVPQGSLRPDLTTEDLAFVVWSQSRINQATRAIAPRAWRRHLYLMLDGFRAESAHPCRSLR